MTWERGEGLIFDKTEEEKEGVKVKAAGNPGTLRHSVEGLIIQCESDVWVGVKYDRIELITERRRNGRTDEEESLRKTVC